MNIYVAELVSWVEKILKRIIRAFDAQIWSKVWFFGSQLGFNLGNSSDIAHSNLDDLDLDFIDVIWDLPKTFNPK